MFSELSCLNIKDLHFVFLISFSAGNGAGLNNSAVDPRSGVEF